MGCKVDTLVERHALTVPAPGYESVDDYLVTRWTGADGRSADGYKTLTEWFNKRLLRRLYEDHDREVASVHLDREYDLITGEAEGEEGILRDELAADLSTDGLDIDEVAGEMVSWSTMRHHLKGCLEAEKETATATTDWEVNAVRIAQDRANEKTESVLSSLANKGRLPDATRATVDVQVKLSCPECSVRVPFLEAVERGYVCETHVEDDVDEGVGERVRERLSGLTFPYVAVEALNAVLLEETLLVDAAVTAGL